MMKQQKLFTFMAILVLLVAAVSAAVYVFDLDFNSGVSGHPLAVDTYATDESVSTLSTSMNTFAFDLYRQFSQGEEGNVFFSPYSLFVALAMTYEGARGTTALEMQDVLHFPQNNETSLCSFGRIYNLLNHDKEYILNTANALWIQENGSILEEYIGFLEHYYMAQATNVDFHFPEDAAQIINRWVDKNTHGKIPDFLTSDDIDPLTRLILTNAIYFKGLWETPFDTEKTQETDFAVSPGESIRVPMMHSSSDLGCNYTETETLQIVELPFQGDTLSMVILLPKSNDLSGLEEMMTYSDFSAWKTSLSHQKVSVALPTFKLETRYKVGNYLKEMGMMVPFTGAADFSGMTGSRDLHIGKVIHQAVIEVTEEGSEAAAATSIHMELTSSLQDSISFMADHPFLFFIQHKQTGVILFMGRMQNPLD